MCIHCLQWYKLNRCHRLLLVDHLIIFKTKFLLVTFLPTQNMEYRDLSWSFPFSSILFVVSLMAAGGKRGRRKVYTNEGNTVGAMYGVCFLCFLSQLEHLLWSVPSPSHPHKHCLTLVESDPLCWLNFSLYYRHPLDDFFFFSYNIFLLLLFFNSHFAMCFIGGVPQNSWVFNKNEGIHVSLQRLE